MTINIEVATEGDLEVWYQVLRTSSHSTIFHTWDWLKIMEKYTNTKLYPLVGYKGTTPIGIYPLFYLKKKMTKLVFSPPPKTLLLYLGPVISNYEKLKQSRRETLFMEFQRSIDEFIMSELNSNYIRIRTPPGLLDFRPLKWAGYNIEPHLTYIIDLKSGLDSVWENFNRKLRVAIEKTRREGIKVELGNSSDLEYLRKAICDRFREQGFKVSKNYYKNYLEQLYRKYYPNNMKIFVAKYKTEDVGGFILLHYKDRATLWIGIPKTSLKGVYPNDLAQWEAIKWAYENGFKYYEIMGAGENPRLRHYKAKFNPEIFLWWSAVRYSSTLYEVIEKIAKKLKLV